MAYGWGYFGDGPHGYKRVVPKNGPTQRTRKGKVKRGR